MRQYKVPGQQMHSIEEGQETYREVLIQLLLVLSDKLVILGAIIKYIHYLYNYWQKAITVRLFCPSRAHQEARKSVVVSKWHQNFWTKHFH